MLLAIDTATRQAGCALLDGDGIRAELAWEAGKNHSRDLGKAVREVWALGGAGVADIDSLAVTSGPGSFSGLRVGIAYAKGLALARHIPLVGVPTLDALAFQASALSTDVTAVLSAGRGDVYVARYMGQGENWKLTTAYLLMSLGDTVELAEGSLLVGDASAAVAEAGRSAGITLSVAPVLWQLRRPGFLAELGKRYLDAGGADQRDTLEPLYLRRSAAEETRAAGG